jgi:hypothetical protein
MPKIRYAFAPPDLSGIGPSDRCPRASRTRRIRVYVRLDASMAEGRRFGGRQTEHREDERPITVIPRPSVELKPVLRLAT